MCASGVFVCQSTRSNVNNLVSLSMECPRGFTHSLTHFERWNAADALRRPTGESAHCCRRRRCCSGEWHTQLLALTCSDTARHNPRCASWSNYWSDFGALIFQPLTCWVLSGCPTRDAEKCTFSDGRNSGDSSSDKCGDHTDGQIASQ